jgi:hypothetical protein
MLTWVKWAHSAMLAMSTSSLPNVLVMLYRALKRISPLAPGFTRWQMFQPTRRIRDRVVLAPTCLNRHLSTVIGHKAQPLLCPMHQEMWDLQLLPSFVGAIRSQKRTTFPAISHSLLLSSLASSFLNPFFFIRQKEILRNILNLASFLYCNLISPIQHYT